MDFEGRKYEEDDVAGRCGRGGGRRAGGTLCLFGGGGKDTLL